MDQHDFLTPHVREANPVSSGSFKTYALAQELVSNRHTKGSLVALVNYLLMQGNTYANINKIAEELHKESIDDALSGVKL
tara:strand:+ start:1182 stop:1421 length:240 start_codon:yes stop_codon:yes gene_type:complete